MSQGSQGSFTHQGGWAAQGVDDVPCLLTSACGDEDFGTYDLDDDDDGGVVSFVECVQ
ncbi:MAG: hypothetical protein ACK5KU_11830 [Beutenbergiaceae bacterium]